MKDLKHTEQEIKWKTIKIYVDVDTGEILTEAKVRKEYIIINKKKESNVYKSTGTTISTNECRRDQQIKINF